MKVQLQKDKVSELLDKLGHALSDSDFKGASECFAIPSLVVSETGSMVLEKLEQVEQMFAKAGEWYHSQGLVSTKGELESFEVLSETIASIDVRWPSFDNAGIEKSSERSRYIIQTNNGGQFRICCALTRTK
ncbi:MAG TPA: hypothetical protein VGQ55_12280 [Pyrinomonadaceae bacterium]|jgi:hypothetical protein|nr:hypothetical protein [Pyrinomonadaceae bacterium]